jgi:hypothetical protein
MKERNIEMNDNEKRQAAHECAKSPISATNKLGTRGQTLEDLWIYEQEQEKMKASRAKPGACSKECGAHEGKCCN